MANLKQWVLSVAAKEKIEAVVIGNMGWSDYKLETIPEASQDKSNWNKVLSWRKAAPLLDYEFDSGYGSPGCQAITVWTKSKVIFISQYDGSTGVTSVPRNPVDPHRKCQEAKNESHHNRPALWVALWLPARIRAPAWGILC